jgi:hypothetical protein
LLILHYSLLLQTLLSVHTVSILAEVTASDLQHILSADSI